MVSGELESKGLSVRSTMALNGLFGGLRLWDGGMAVLCARSNLSLVHE
jgi:hypothetical protein